jgi:hypothetical protein
LRQADAVRADFYPISVELTRPPSRKGGLCRARYCRAGVRALPGLMHRGAAEAPFRHRHLLGIEGLSPDDTDHVLDLADGYVELNRQAEKKHGLLRGRTIINLLLRELDARPFDREGIIILLRFLSIKINLLTLKGN